MTIPVADMAATGVAVSAVRDFATRAALDPLLAMRLAIVVEELVTNLVEYGGPSTAPITLALMRVEGRVVLRLTDHGASYDPRNNDGILAPSARGGGAGLALVRAWADMVAYRTAGATNMLTLIMHRTTSG